MLVSRCPYGVLLWTVWLHVFCIHTLRPVIYFGRLDFLWSGCLRRASSSASTRCRATSGPTESCCGRSFLWVTSQSQKSFHDERWGLVCFGCSLWSVCVCVYTCTGKSPYPNIAVDTKFYKMIQDGCHMTQPDFAPSQMWAIVDFLFF